MRNWLRAADPWLRTAGVITAAGLAIDAYVHFDLAPTYGEISGTINEGVLFRIEAVLAILTAVAILVTGRRAAYMAAVVVGASALTVMLMARYVDLGPLGPFPDFHDPVWFPEKLLAAFAEGVATVAAIAGVMLTSRASRARRLRGGTAVDCKIAKPMRRHIL